MTMLSVRISLERVSASQAALNQFINDHFVVFGTQCWAPIYTSEYVFMMYEVSSELSQIEVKQLYIDLMSRICCDGYTAQNCHTPALAHYFDNIDYASCQWCFSEADLQEYEHTLLEYIPAAMDFPSREEYYQPNKLCAGYDDVPF